MRSIMADHAANYAFLEALARFPENMRPFTIMYFGSF